MGRTQIPQSSGGARTGSGMACVVSVLVSRKGCAGLRRLPRAGKCWDWTLLFSRQRETGDVDTFYLEGCLFPETTEVPGSVWDPCHICLVQLFEAADLSTVLGPHYCSLRAGGGDFWSTLSPWLPLDSYLLVLLIEAQKNIDGFS